LIRGIFPQSNYNNNVDYKFSRAGYNSTAFLWNAADVLTIWLLCAIVIPILWALKFIFSHVEIIGNLEDRFRKAFVYILIMVTYLRVSFCVALCLANADFSNFTAGLSTTIALLFGCVIIAYPLYEFYNAITFHRELMRGNRPTYLRLNILFYDFGVVSSYQFFFYWQFFLRRFLLAVMIVAWPQARYLTL
jgi:hypothetical protein